MRRSLVQQNTANSKDQEMIKVLELKVDYCKQDGDSLVFVPNEVVVPFDGSPDGGRSLIFAAEVEADGKKYSFYYREKYYGGLGCYVEDGEASEFFYSPEPEDLSGYDGKFPIAWAKQPE